MIIRDFIQNLKAFAGWLEDGLRERLTDEDEENNVRAIARCASAELRANSAHKDLILASRGGDKVMPRDLLIVGRNDSKYIIWSIKNLSMYH